MKSKLTSRKFWLVVGIVVIATGLLVFKQISSDQWMTLIIAIISGYLVVNSAQNVGNNMVLRYQAGIDTSINKAKDGADL